MATLTETFTNIADGIRHILGGSQKYTPAQMASTLQGITNRGSISGRLSPGGSKSYSAGYYTGGTVTCSNASPTSKLVGISTGCSTTNRSGGFINITKQASVSNSRISMICVNGCGVNDGGSQIGSTTVTARKTDGNWVTCSWNGSYYVVPTDTTYNLVSVNHQNYGGSQMSHGFISPIWVFGY